MTRFAVFGAGPLAAFNLDADAAHILRSPALDGILEELEQDREGEADISWPLFGSGLTDARPDFTLLSVGPGFL
jgi:hypothetical protein